MPIKSSWQSSISRLTRGTLCRREERSTSAWRRSSLGRIDPGRIYGFRFSDNGIWHGRCHASRKRSSLSSRQKPPGKGTGLGLSMVHGLAVQLGGWLELLSEIGKRYDRVVVAARRHAAFCTRKQNLSYRKLSRACPGNHSGGRRRSSHRHERRRYAGGPRTHSHHGQFWQARSLKFLDTGTGRRSYDDRSSYARHEWNRARGTCTSKAPHNAGSFWRPGTRIYPPGIRRPPPPRFIKTVSTGRNCGHRSTDCCGNP